jgi:hypothetical protein
MKKSIFGLAVFFIAAMMAFGLTSQSYAIEGLQTPGDVLLFPYYDARSVADGGLGLTDNYFSVTNTSVVWVQSHVRIRTGRCSVELLDFDILQSPKDNFVFDIYSDGGITFASCDANTLEDSGFTLNYDADGDGTNDCFILSSATFPAMLSLITTCGNCETGAAVGDAEALEMVRKGYVEVIQEGSIEPKSTDKTLCASDTDDTPTIPGHSLRYLYDDAECVLDIYAPTKELEGRQYFVEVDLGVSPVIVKRLAQANASVLDSWSDHGLFLHEDTYALELAAAECNAADGSETSCYAYAAAEVTDAAGATADGANDMNYCFYTEDISGDLVINKFGAAATFGPTLADMYDQRDGYLYTTSENIVYGIIYYGQVMPYTYYFYTSDSDEQKQWVDSHYFYAPLPGAYDMLTAFAFTFPAKHFIGEKETIQAVEIYDNSENTTTLEIGKFISPGLPSAATYSEEAALFKLTPPFNEGWIRFAVLASNATVACDDLDWPTTCPVEAYADDWSGWATTNYIPAYVGFVFTTGSEVLGVSHFLYNDDYYEWDNSGIWGDSR